MLIKQRRRHKILDRTSFFPLSDTDLGVSLYVCGGGGGARGGGGGVSKITGLFFIFKLTRTERSEESYRIGSGPSSSVNTFKRYISETTGPIRPNFFSVASWVGG